MDLDVLKIGIRARLRRHLGDVELVVDVAVDVEPGRDDGVDRLECNRARDRNVAEELAAHRIGDDGALVADDRVVESGLDRVRPRRDEHASRDDDHVRARRADRGDRGARARVEHGVLGDQRPVEIAGEGGDPARKVGRQLQQRYGVPPVAVTTYEATSAICWSVSWPLNDGMAPFPSVTRAVALRKSGFDWSRFGPTVPVEWASARVWQPVQPALRKIALPAVGSPLSVNAGVAGSSVGVGSEPMTAFGTGFTTPWAPHPARTTAPARHAAEMRAARRTGARLYSTGPPGARGNVRMYLR